MAVAIGVEQRAEKRPNPRDRAIPKAGGLSTRGPQGLPRRLGLGAAQSRVVLWEGWCSRCGSFFVLVKGNW